MNECPYKISSTEKVRNVEKELERELAELTAELDDNDIISGNSSKNPCSVSLPKDVKHFRREREMVLNRAMQVCEAKPLAIQCNVMQEEIDSCTRSDYSLNSLPLLIHQFFLDRIQQLVQCKHMHMLRWKRFCEHTSVIESLYACYQARVTQIMSEFNDCVHRVERLSVAREAMLADGDASESLHADDLFIYLRWLICHLHSTKRFNQYMRMLEWFPIIHKKDINLPSRDDEKSEDKIAYQVTLSFHAEAGMASDSMSNASDASVPMLVPEAAKSTNPFIASTYVQPYSQMSMAIAAAGGGMSSEEVTLTIPVHTSDLSSLKPQLLCYTNIYNIDVDVQKVFSFTEEMELFVAVNRKFKTLYTRQEQMNTFKTYDALQIGEENWGVDSCSRALLQDSNWLPFITLQPQRDLYLHKKMVQLRSKKSVDELLNAMAKFLEISDTEKVLDALREHATAIQTPPTAEPVSVTSHRTPNNTRKIWNRIYNGPKLHDSSTKKAHCGDETDVDKANQSRTKRHSPKLRKDSYDYVNTLQMLGLDEPGTMDNGDTSSIQGAYLSFLMLRHLRIRDLQRTCLSVLNYFRSVERTLTINDGGLSLEAGSLKRVSRQNHRQCVIDGSSGGGGGLDFHHYLHFTPKDYKLKEADFMQFSEVENHDNFYTFEDGRTHVQDQQGYYVIYTAAKEDLKKLKEDLILIASHYIEKDKTLRSSPRSKPADLTSQQNDVEIDIASYGHQEVDRFAVLLDLWTNEAAYLECKKELFDCYFEAYHHVFDRDERRHLAQVLTNLMYSRPQLDFTASYFVRSYRMQCICLRQHTELIKSILDKQLEEQRDYIKDINREGGPEFGLPHKIIARHPISVTMSRPDGISTLRSALKNIYFLEFHPSMAVASRLPDALRHAFVELCNLHNPSTATDKLHLESQMLSLTLRDWQQMVPPDTPYTTAIQRDLFSGVFVENPRLMTEVVLSCIQEANDTASKKTPKDKHLIELTTLSNALQLITLRHRLVDSAIQSAQLSKIYRSQALQLGYDESHLFMRFIQYELAKYEETAGTPPPISITSVLEEETSVDRYTPNSLLLAINEVDESHVGRFSFRTRESVLQLLRKGSPESLQVVLLCQIVQVDALTCAIQQVNSCQPLKQRASDTSRPVSPPTRKGSTKNSQPTQLATSANAPTNANLVAPHSARPATRSWGISEAFVSLQLEKIPSRDLMLNEYVKKKQQMGIVLNNPEKLEELKRVLITEYCTHFFQRISQYSLRGQIIVYYNSITTLLNQFPSIRDTCFMMGEDHEKKSPVDNGEVEVNDPRHFSRRPRAVLSADGRRVLNIWFIPHASESLGVFKKLDNSTCCTALTHLLRIAAALHDMLHYLAAHSRLGSGAIRLGRRVSDAVSATWGGTEGVGTDLLEIQREVDNLSDKTNPEEVCNFLTLRRDVMFLEFDTAVRHAMRDTFLATNNLPAYQAVTECMHFALHNLSNAQVPAFNATYMNVPEPFEARDSLAAWHYPWRSFINRNGLFPTHFHQVQQIEYNMQLCLASLKDVDRHVCNGEILGVTLLLEDVLTSGKQDKLTDMLEDELDEPAEEKADMTDISQAPSRMIMPSVRPTSSDVLTRHDRALLKRACDRRLARSVHPVQSYTLLKQFLRLWKQLEVGKAFWAEYRLNLRPVNTATAYATFTLEYRREILYPILQTVARRPGKADLYTGMVNDHEPLVMPKGTCEIELRTRQLMKLLEYAEIQIIQMVRKKVSTELNQVLTEHTRGESGIPTDLWKRPAIKETFSVLKPHIAESFISTLMESSNESDDVISFPKYHLQKCLTKLSTDVMVRERQNYENYSMYYENLLRTHHQLLYKREQEVKRLGHNVELARNETDVEVKCQLADCSEGLLLEVTALRAKVTEMRDAWQTQQVDVRQSVKHDYASLIDNLFSNSFDLKKQFDEFRINLHNDVVKHIAETRTEAIQAMSRLKQKSTTEQEQEVVYRGLMHASQIEDLQKEIHLLNMLLLKLKAMNYWKTAVDRQSHQQQLASLQKSSDKNKKDYIGVRMVSEEAVVLLQQQQMALRNALKVAEKKSEEIKKRLIRELDDKKERQHEIQQKQQNERQLEHAKNANIDRLVSKLGDREVQLQALSAEHKQDVQIRVQMSDKLKKNTTDMRKRLHHERYLKLDAFQRVDQLQAQIYDIESGIYGLRPQTAAKDIRVGSANTRITSGSKSTLGRRGTLTSYSSSVDRKLHLRPMTADVFQFGSRRQIERPKTTLGHLPNHAVTQLLGMSEPQPITPIKPSPEMQTLSVPT